MTTQPDIRDLSYQELVAYLHNQGERAYRAQQIFDWIYKKGVMSFEEMKNLPQGLQDRLKKDFIFYKSVPGHEMRAADATTKFLFHLHDSERIETVLIPTETRTTVCVSTQAGCKFACKFCASGIGGWARNLSCAEIISQILYAQTRVQDISLSNVVFMGVGEPLDNYDNLLKAIRLMNAPAGMNFAARRITISTCGLVPKILQLAKEGLQVELAVSLHGANNESRQMLMPVNKKYPLHELIEACRTYAQATHRQITFEYILIKEVTCTPTAAQELGKLLNGLLCKINLIPYNRVEEFPHEAPTRSEMYAFRNRLKSLGITATLRRPRGPDVAAACGQLRHSSSKS